MSVFIVKNDTPLFKSSADLTKIGDLKRGARFEGALSATDFDLADKTDDPRGVVPLKHLMRVPAVLPGISTETDRSSFCWAVTDAAAEEKADRNYLLAVAYHLSKELAEFGKPADLRYGPFRYTVEEWLGAFVDGKVPGHEDIEPEHLFDPGIQLTMAAIRTGKAMARYQAAHNVYPLPLELFFYERLGEEGLKLLALGPDQTCAAAVTVTPPGSYGADIKDRKSGDVIREVKDGLIAGFVASRADVARLQPHRRFFSDEDMAPWLTVARLMTAEDLRTKPTTLAGTFLTFPPALGANDRLSAAFVAFCLVESGVAEAQASVPEDNKAGLPETWKTWSREARDPLRSGTIVVTNAGGGRASVGILAQKPADDNYKVYFCSDEGKMSVGVKTIAKAEIDVLRWLDITGSGDDPDPSLGSLSKKYESGTNGAGTISSGSGDSGGVSYGTYQFSSTKGSAAEFVASLPAALKARFGEKRPGSAEFSATWREIARDDPVGFGKLQHDYIKKQYYDRLVDAVIAACAGFNVNDRSAALQNCFWSTAVQHGVGGATPIIRDVINRLRNDGAPPLAPVKPFDRVALEKIYAERGSGPIGAMKYFSANSAAVQEGVAARFRSELADALKMLDGE